MKSKNLIITIIVIIILIGSIIFFYKKDNSNSIANVPKLNSEGLGGKEDKDVLLRKAISYMENECPRSIPESIIDSKVFPGVTSTLEPEERESSGEVFYALSNREEVTIDNNTNVIILNHGCEYYGLTFIFDTSEYSGDINDIPYWAQSSVSLMDKVLKGVTMNDVPIDLKGEMERLLLAVSSQKARYIFDAYNQFSVSSLGEMHQTVSMHQPRKLENGKYEVRIDFNVGPL